MLKELQHIIVSLNQNLEQKKFLLALSGGADSVALFHLFRMLNLEFEVAHCNYGLRGKESDLDEEFVLKLASHHNIKYHSKKFPTNAIKESSSDSIQMLARNLRYTFFDTIVKERKLDFIVTAHHLDDRIETFFLNLFRGTGINGLTPLEHFNSNRFRPLNSFSKEEILSFLNEHQFGFREDQSNKSLKYERNKIRHQIIPEIAKINPEFRKIFLQNFKLLGEEKQEIENKKSNFLKSIQSDLNNQNFAEIPLSDFNSKIKYFWLSTYLKGSPKQGSEIEKLTIAQKGSTIQIENHLLHREENSITVEILQQKFSPLVIDSLPYQSEHIEINILEEKPTRFNPDSIYLDFDTIKLPFTIRTWDIGDRIQPLGMKGSKLVSDYLTDKKIRKINRNKTLVLECSNKIHAILGHVCSEESKITTTSNKIIHVRIFKS